MNRHNFLQFNPNSYKKHLSPFGQNVLDTLIKHWRTGFDSKENRHQHQFTTNQNRRNVRAVYEDSRPIPSVPSSPSHEASYEREIHTTTNNFVTDNHHISTLSVDQVRPGKANYESDIVNNQGACHNDAYFAMPRLRSDYAPQNNTHISKNNFANVATNNKNIFNQQHDGHNYEKLILNNSLLNMPIKQILHAGTNSKLLNDTVPASSELIKTVEIPNTNDEEILTANDMVTPVINFENVNENFLSSKKVIETMDGTDIPSLQFIQILNNDTIKKQNGTRGDVMTAKDNELKQDVQWENMFDTELFLDLNTPLQVVAPLEDDNERFKIEFPKDKKRNQIVPSNKVTKRTNQSKICDSLSKKVKRVKYEQKDTNTSKKSVRKIKYTKAVKNWLDDVDPVNTVEDKMEQNIITTNEAIIPKPIATPIGETCDEKLEVEGKGTALEKNERPTLLSGINKILQKESEMSETVLQSILGEVVDNGSNEISDSKATALNETVTVKVSTNTEVEKNPKGKSKKVVQARLAQKDGKMKFGPPVKDNNVSNLDNSTDNEVKNKETIKQKKAKAKFVAPIKSQVPVKNVTFDVNTIDDSNIHQIKDLMNAENNDVTIIVTYSNGYCQLNNHHTEDTCVPDGIMIQSGNQFFYFKDKMHNSNVIMQILERFQVICYNGKELLIYVTSKYGIELKQDAFKFHDAKIGGNLIDPDNPPENFAELQKLLGFTLEFTIATECVLQKAAWYTTLLKECFEKLRSLLTENCVWNVFIEIEMRLLPVIAGMEQRGVSVDLEKLKSMEEVLLTKMKAVEQECYKAAGKTFQINSALQVRTILYDELQLDTRSNLKIKETIGKGAKSTSETMLRGLVSVHPLPRLILEYRHLHKAHATFVTGIAQHVKDGLVKPTWVQTAAATGRIASNNPNLQAIPKAPFSLVVFPEKSDDQEPQLNFRCVYTARSGHWLVAADFKHVECRVFAHAAADAALLTALRDQRDLFCVLAAKWLNKPVEAVSSEDRERTKRIVYASLYGAGARKLMEILHVGYEQALSVMTSFNRTFPALKTFGQAAVARARAGALRTACGRARRFPHIASAHAALRAHAERQAVNFVVQGSAADLCKTAMVAVQRQLERQAVRGRLLLQIHDELVWEVADEHVTRAATIIKEAMESVGRRCGMELALPVQLTRGRSWGHMAPFPESTPQP